jgi:hypothetical protein
MRFLMRFRFKPLVFLCIRLSGLRLKSLATPNEKGRQMGFAEKAARAGGSMAPALAIRRGVISACVAGDAGRSQASARCLADGGRRCSAGGQQIFRQRQRACAWQASAGSAAGSVQRRLAENGALGYIAKFAPGIAGAKTSGLQGSETLQMQKTLLTPLKAKNSARIFHEMLASA